MSCKTYSIMLHSYLNNELNELETKEVSKHLEKCPDCTKEAEEIKKLKVLASAVKIDMIQLEGLKKNIMSAIRLTKKVRTLSYDIKVLSRLGTSLVACGVLALFLNFSALGSNLEAHSDKFDYRVQEIGQKIGQPISVINKGLSEMSNKIIDLNGITFRIQQRNRGGM